MWMNSLRCSPRRSPAHSTERNGISVTNRPPTPRATLRRQLGGDELIIAPGVFDGLSASITRRIGFAAAYLTGAGVAASGFGLPDIGLLTQTEMAERARVLVSVLGDLPLIADADTGYGAPINIIRTVREYEAAGVAAIQLEDQAFPKKCGHLPDKELIGAEEFVVNLHAALDARIDPELVVIARTDSRGPLGIDAAISRANTYAEAGADVIFVEAPQGIDEINLIAKEVTAPLLINLVLGGLTPFESAQRLQDLGYRIAIHPSAALGAAAVSMVAALAQIADKDPLQWLPSNPGEFFNLVNLAEWSALGESYRRDPAGKS
ncbi:MAG: carboxyvinyl-carboxyphosphonate phosphorylmutase [Mycobacterium sp.]|nr:carboxyvinyl-carboxyphosphonate phosphorylmutase [Mycobacterium sp.]